MILILDLGSTENPMIAREIRAMGVYTEIHPHDITAEELAALPGVKGIILNGGVNRVVDGVEIDASEAVYNADPEGFGGTASKSWNYKYRYSELYASGISRV